MNITKPGIYRDFPTAHYFADPCPEPSLSQSVAKILVEQSPLHAFQAHPRLYVPTADEDADEKYDKARAIGNAAHALMLDRGKVLAVGEFDRLAQEGSAGLQGRRHRRRQGAGPAQAFRDGRPHGRRRARAAEQDRRLRNAFSTATPRW
jgi:hypothetical protein